MWETLALTGFVFAVGCFLWAALIEPVVLDHWDPWFLIGTLGAMVFTFFALIMAAGR